jgi:predicted kinase
MLKLAHKVAARYLGHLGRRKIAGPLRDVSKLRYQAVFLMGAGGSGKSYVVDGLYMKYMPGAGESGASREQLKKLYKQDLSVAERGLSNLKFERAVNMLQAEGYDLELNKGGDSAKIPFRLYNYDNQGRESLIDPKNYSSELPKDILKEIEGLKELVYSAPVHELPTYWRQVNPDLFKEQLQGYRESAPGYVHEMSSEMAKGYFQAAVDTGDPIVVDGTGANLRKMTRQIAQAQEAGYRVTVLYVYVPLAVSQLRNACRARKVDPYVVLNQWKSVHSNFPKLRGMADKGKLIDNTNPGYDRKLWAKNEDMVNNFMLKKTGQTFAEFIMEEAPQEKKELAKLGMI